MKKMSLVASKPRAAFSFLLAFFALLLLSATASFAQGSDNLKSGGDGGNDADLANMFSVRKDYFLRFPHAKVAEDIRSGGRTDDTTKPTHGAKYTLQYNNEMLEIPAGKLIMKQTGEPKSPDPYIAKRPQYRPLFAYCSGAPGAFLPQPQPGMMGMFVPNYSKAASGQGGAVQLSLPLLPTCYVQPLLQVDNHSKMAQEGDQAIWQYELTTFGVGPISDTQFQMLDRESNQRFLELFFDPERWLWSSRAAAIMQQQQMSTNLANTADWGSNTANDTITEMLINVANERAAVEGSTKSAKRTKAEAIFMVQKMYKNVFMLIGILLLLPGAVMTQMKGMVQSGFMGTSDDDTSSPFVGIIRAIVAIFLIPATQLMVSYMIDVGNSMAMETKKWVDIPTITGYAHEQQFGPQRDMTTNCLAPHMKPPISQSQTDIAPESSGEESGGGSAAGTSGGTGHGGQGASGSAGGGSGGGNLAALGKAYGGAENQSIEEETPQLSKQIQVMYNFFNVCATTGVVVLADFQVVMMCYLFLMGPIAAAFYAWPNIKGGGGDGPGIFNKIFGNWIQGVVVLSLWRFWWMVVLACMTTYIQYAKQMGSFNQHSEWEMMVYTSFQVLLLTVPFAPFDFKGSAQVDQVKNIASQKADGGEGGVSGSGSQQGTGKGQSANRSGNSGSST